ncbi:TPA: hypothetical protein JD854_RS09435 [Citrobacter amalonaticus]|uniref:Uncharacterized protein n=1 Tax=Citrobacter amalonaticus TaxID=35703 RepID=A0A9C7QJP9_CITAM|nr:hypothetical protein [Citrobacter amalonaticus]
MNEVQNRRVLALLDMLFYALGNKTECDICHKFFLLVLALGNNLTTHYGTRTSSELSAISYDDANALITELLLFIYDVDVDNHSAYTDHFDEIKRLMSPAIADQE